MQTFSRLLTTFTPHNYALRLALDRPGRSFRGTVTITGAVQHAGSLSLHAKDLTITQATIDDKPATYSHHEHDELRLTQPGLTAGEHTVQIDFTGTITNAMTGLYPCYYQHNGATCELLATQFESHHAREVFPCIDEPSAKARFDVTLITEPGVVVLGNMPIAKQTEQDGALTTTFLTTPVMSSYLLAWVVGDLHKQTAHTKQGVEVNVWATPAQPASSLGFALDIATRCIDFYNDYFGIPYPLPKCDHVALPDFSSGAMENWGLITYREIALLAGPRSSLETKRYVATVICHELAHQWFGNLVTMAWWDDLWLNESFATLMEYIAVDALEPDWNIWRDFASNEAVMAMRRDSLDGVQPVHLPVNHPDEISTLFDGAIVYAKGAKLMRMLQHYIGDDAFRRGLTDYFTTHTYHNTSGTDLWRALGASSGKDIAGFMNTWISQPGLPLITITPGEHGAQLSQQQFFIGPHTPSQRLWPIPLASTAPQLPQVFDTKQLTTSLTTPFFINNEDTSYVITHYPDSFMTARLAEIADGTASEITRLQFLNEQILLAKAGITSLAKLLPVLHAYQHETNQTVWSMISLAISELRRLVEDDTTAQPDTEQQLQQVVGTIIRPQFERLGLTPQPDESDNDRILRGIITSLALYSDLPNVRQAAHHMYTTTPLAELDPELRASLIANEVRHFGAAVDTLLDHYAAETDSEIQGDLASGITAATNPQAITTILDAMTHSQVIRPQDVFRWFAYLMRNHASRQMTWQWLQDNWAWVDATFRGDKSLDTFPRYSANSLATATQLQQYRQFFTPHQTNPSLARAITVGQAEIEGRIDYIKRDGPAVRQALDELTTAATS